MRNLRYHEVPSFSPNSQRSIKVLARAGCAAAFVFLLGAGLPFAAHAQTCANPPGGYEGFGRNTTGGAGQPLYRVTTLNDNPTNPTLGMLRHALLQGNRCIVFDVGGTISLTSALLAHGANITIDGFTALSPGITLTGWGFDLHHARNVANVIVRGIRIRDTASPESLGADGFQIVGVNNFVIDHVSVARWGDGSLDIAGEGTSPINDSLNGTIQWSIIGKGNVGSYPDGHDTSLLVKYGARRISLHHNLFINAWDRSPYCAWSDDLTKTPLAGEIVCDFRNNLVWGYGLWGTSVRHNGTANVVNNYYSSSPDRTADDALQIREGGIAYASGNYSPSGLDIDGMGNRATPFPAEPVSTTDAVTAAHQILAKAGARVSNKFDLDPTDQDYINQISLTPLNGVVLLALHENGSDGSTAFADASDFHHPLTPAADAQWDTAQAPPGLTSSGLFDGNADQIEAASNTSFKFGTGDFTVEFFVRLNAINKASIMFDMRAGVPGEVAMNIYHQSNGKLAFSREGPDLIFSLPGQELVENTWYHIAVARRNGVTKMFKNGTQVGDPYADTNNYSQGHILIGNRYANPNLAVNGWMAGVRVTRGVARYTSNFTPPALPYMN
jgi:pectate lyase